MRFQESDVTTPPPNVCTSRTESVSQVCDELASEGAKPTLRLVRARGHGRVRGSDGDVQNEIKEWFNRLLHQYSAQKVDDQIPIALADAFRSFWQMALTESGKQFAEERDRLVATTTRTEGQLTEMTEANGVLDATVLRLKGELAIARQTIESMTQAAVILESQLADVGRRCEHQAMEIDSLNRATATLHENNAARINTLLREQESRVREQSELHDRALTRLADEHTSRLSELREQMHLAEVRYQALEQRSLMEIDAARESAKDKERQLRAASQTIADLEARATSTTLAYGILESKHEELKTAIDKAESDLADERKKNVELAMNIARIEALGSTRAVRKSKKPTASSQREHE